MMLYLLVFLSGFAGLVYEVLWMKQLGLLFGNTSHAAAATLAAFFAGLAAGSWFWGRRCQRMKNPLRVYAWLEVGIASAALIYFGILDIYFRIYPALYQGVDSAMMLLAVKFVLALLLVFPPAFFMGGTIPVMGQHVIRNLSRFGTTSALLYGVNTMGAALGAGLAGFFLPLWLGFKFTCVAAIMVSGTVALAAFRLSRGETAGVASQSAGGAASGAKAGNGMGRDGRWIILPMCFLSGFGVLALEVLWTRMFAQVLENSVYTFAAILVLVLVSLAFGSLVSSSLARLDVPPARLLALLTLLGGFAVAVTPFVFMRVTDSFKLLALRVSWPHYVMEVFRHVGMVIAVPAVILGTIFPFLMKTEERYADSAGRSLGRLSAVNTAGAILGSLLCGFILLRLLGMWGTMRAMAILYIAAACVIPGGRDWKGIGIRAAGIVVLILQFVVLDPTHLPVSSVDPMRPRDKVVETWQGSDCSVSVTRNQDGTTIRINSDYGLGSTGAYMQERMQNGIPLNAWPGTRSIFFLGLGTGITAGGALDPQFSNVTRVVACELVPEVITAARKYIADCDGYDFTGGLFADPRVTLLTEDGRHYLMAGRDKFDMVNADLFIPFRAGAGSLYSREHFEGVKARLEPGGVFVQWLPLYQVTDSEFGTIARTMLDVFDQVSLWRSNFQPGDEVVAIVGHKGRGPLPASGPGSMEERKEAVAGRSHRDLSGLSLPFNPQTVLFFYCGNLTAARQLFNEYPVNTDDRQVIEYMAPRTYRNNKDTMIPWFVGPRLARLVDRVHKICPPAADPLLSNRSPADRRLPVAGSAFHWARVWEVIGNEKECRQEWQRFVAEWTDGVRDGK